MNATQIKQMELEVSKLCRFLKVQGKAISTERAYAGAEPVRGIADRGVTGWRADRVGPET